MGLADFCLNPLQNIVNILSSEDGELRSLAVYYTSCEGSNPIQNILSSSFRDIVTLNSSLESVSAPGAPCDGNDYILSMQGDLGDIYSALYTIHLQADCPAISSHWQTVFYDGVCNHAYRGLIIVWISQGVTIGLLFMLTFLVGVLYQYFGHYWNLSKEDILATSLEEGDPFQQSSNHNNNDAGHYNETAINPVRSTSGDHAMEGSTLNTTFSTSKSKNSRKRLNITSGSADEVYNRLITGL